MRALKSFIIMWSGLTAASANAAGIAFNAYFGLTLGGNSTFFGTRWGPESVPPPEVTSSLEHTPRPAFDLRYVGGKDSDLTINGIALRRMLIRNASEGGATDTSGDTGKEIDWYLVAGVAVGAALIAALVAADDVSVKACSGPNCPPAQKPPPPKPEPTTPAEGQ